MNAATTTLPTTTPALPSQADVASHVSVQSTLLLRLVRQGFSDDEWARLNSRPDFQQRLDRVASIDDAQSAIQYGADILEGTLVRPSSFAHH